MLFQERIAQALRLIHEIWASILEVGTALWLLERQLQLAFLVPLIITLGKSPIIYIKKASLSIAFLTPMQHVF